MARILLILPHLPQRMGAPYLGQQYLAASLLAAGHEVRCLDMAAVRFNGSDETAIEVTNSFRPHLIGMTLFTYNAARGYQLAKQLRSRCNLGLLVAGGAHPTCLPFEPLEFGFDVSVAGEGERSIVAIAANAETNDSPHDIPGVYVGNNVVNRPSQAAKPIDDLDSLAFPLESYPCFDAKWYSEAGMTVPGGLMTSRGCPARCTFCANYVTGRAFRWRSADNVVAEMLALQDRYGVRHFPFWDDAFTARRDRLRDLCGAILQEPKLRGITWTCITPGNMVKRDELELMKRAGCVAINFGIESGDPLVLQKIQKGQRPDHVETAVRLAKQAGMQTIVNFMFGFPEETAEQLATTFALMKQLSPFTDFFNNRGVLVPFPGTQIYDRWNEKYGFQRWWLDPSKVVDEPNLQVLDPTKSQRYLEHDPTLELNFFHYSDRTRQAIADCVRFKAEHNQRSLDWQDPTLDTLSPPQMEEALERKAIASC